MKKIDLALALCGVLAACNAGALTIDSFDTTQSNKRVANGASVDIPINTSGAGVTYIGTSRTLSSQAATGETSWTDARIATASYPSALYVANNASPGTVYVQWNGISGSDRDFTAGNALGLRISLPALVNNALTVTFLVNGTSSASRTFTSSTSDDLFTFASFTDRSVFADVSTLRMTTTMTLGTSDPTGWAAIGLVETVPLPGTLMLVGIGLAGLARSVKRA
ncbi:PEP-CTERM sorting domain-containing protein [Candidatus Thiodictyon syntrophicum]|jgi:hypothetical protein|nr:PEP-CTERM sorting domain-containing protein [Candidatus Thiodictyon syntrophicum]